MIPAFAVAVHRATEPQNDAVMNEHIGHVIILVNGVDIGDDACLSSSNPAR
jgi:hypothetical protein